MVASLLPPSLPSQVNRDDTNCFYDPVTKLLLGHRELTAVSDENFLGGLSASTANGLDFLHDIISVQYLIRKLK